MRPLFLVLPCLLACEPHAGTPSDQIEYAWQFNIEYAIEQEAGLDHTARARLYDIAQAYDFAGDAGTIELSEGDAIFADGIELDIETHTMWLDILRVDYSQSIPPGADSYPFEFRRPDDELIATTIPIPEPFEVDDIGDLPHDLTSEHALTWSPIIEGATVDITILPLTDGCLTLIDGQPGAVATRIEDVGSFDLDHDLYHALDHDCTYELSFVRRHVHTEPASWYRDGAELPANDIYAIGLHTVRKTFTALQR